MVHSVYSDRDIFLRELVANAADACEKLRTSHCRTRRCSATTPICASRFPPRAEDPYGGGQRHRHEPGRDGRGAGHHRPIGHQGVHGADRGAKGDEGAQLIGQFGVGFYSAFMVAERVDVLSRQAGSVKPGSGPPMGRAPTRSRRDSGEAPVRGTRVILHLKEGATPTPSATRWNASSRPSPASAGADRPRREARRGAAEIADGAAIWAKPRTEITPEDYTDFYAAWPASSTSRR